MCIRDRKYRVLEKLESLMGHNEYLDEMIELLPELTEQLEKQKNEIINPKNKENRSKKNQSISSFDGNLIGLIDDYYQLFFPDMIDYRDEFDFDHFFMCLIFIKWNCDSRTELASSLSLPIWDKITKSKDSVKLIICLLYTSPSPRDATLSRMPSSA